MEREQVERTRKEKKESEEGKRRWKDKGRRKETKESGK